MVALRAVVVALSVLLAADVGAAAPSRPHSSAHTRTATKRPVRKLVQKRPAPHRQARIAPQVSRPSTLLVETPSGRNTAPQGATDAERTLQQRLDSIMGSDYLKSAINGVHVVDAKTGEVLYSYAADRQLNPASNTKLISTATALTVLGPEYTYETTLFGPEPDAEGVVHGDVTLRGSGDPTLRSAHLGELAEALRARGVTKIEGDVVMSSDDRDALAHPYVRVTVRGSGRDGELASVRIHPDSGYFVVDNRALTGAVKRKKGRVTVGAIRLPDERSDGAKLRIAVAGRVRRGQEVAVVRAVPKPVLFTGYTLRAALLGAGVEVTGVVKQAPDRPDLGEEMVQLATHDSVPLSQLAALINKPSNNFLADKLIMTAGAEKFGGDRTMQKGVRAMSEWLDGIGIESGSYRLENGSGLSHMIHVSARQIATVLLAGAKDERIGKDWVESFAVGGVDGTLRSRFAGHPSAGYVFGKTGTLNGVSSLSGFVTLSDDASVCFSVLSSGFRPKRKQLVRASQALVADAIFEYLQARNGGAPAVAAPAGGTVVDEEAGEETDGEVEGGGEEAFGNPDVEL